MRCLFFDPGKTTGYSVVEWDVTLRQASVVAVGDFPTYSLVSFLIESKQPDIVGYERFILNAQWNHNPDHLEPIEVIGVIKYLASIKGLSLIGQTPGNRVGMDKAYRGFFPPRGSSEHMKSATAHALTLLYKKYGGFGLPATLDKMVIEHRTVAETIDPKITKKR